MCRVNYLKLDFGATQEHVVVNAKWRAQNFVIESCLFLSTDLQSIISR